MLQYLNDPSVCFAEVDPALRRDVLNGLASRPRTIPARWFYDRVGSELFEAITSLPEYHVTRSMLRRMTESWNHATGSNCNLKSTHSGHGGHTERNQNDE